MCVCVCVSGVDMNVCVGAFNAWEAVCLRVIMCASSMSPLSLTRFAVGTRPNTLVAAAWELQTIAQTQQFPWYSL